MRRRRRVEPGAGTCVEDCTSRSRIRGGDASRCPGLATGPSPPPPWSHCGRTGRGLLWPHGKGRRTGKPLALEPLGRGRLRSHRAPWRLGRFGRRGMVVVGFVQLQWLAPHYVAKQRSTLRNLGLFPGPRPRPQHDCIPHSPSVSLTMAPESLVLGRRSVRGAPPERKGMAVSRGTTSFVACLSAAASPPLPPDNGRRLQRCRVSPKHGTRPDRLPCRLGPLHACPRAGSASRRASSPHEDCREGLAQTSCLNRGRPQQLHTGSGQD